MKNIFETIFNEDGDFDPLLAFEPIGITVRYKGGSPKQQAPPSSTLTDTPERQAARDELFPMLRNALAGRGFGPESLTRRRDEDRFAGLKTSFNTARGEVESQLSRTVDPRDTRVTSFVSQGLDRAFNTAQDNLKRQIRSERVSDEQLGRELTADTIAQEQRMSISGAQSFNQQMAINFSNQQEFGTFGTNVAGGIGSGLTDAFFARKFAGTATP